MEPPTSLHPFLMGVAGGFVPGVIMAIVYLCTLAGRLAKIETNIMWLIGELKGSRLRSKNRFP